MKTIALIIELVGIIAISAGIGIEISQHAEAGYMAISIGSALVAAGGIIWGKFLRRG